MVHIGPDKEFIYFILYSSKHTHDYLFQTRDIVRQKNMM